MKIKQVSLILCGLSLMMSLNILKTNATPTYTSTCLESRADDSRSFGTSLAVDEDYLAVGDPEANRVVIYTRKTDGNWQRIREIYPPKPSLAKKRGYGFGSELALNNNVLVIRAYDYKNILETIPSLTSIPNNKVNLGFETYSTLLQNDKINPLQKIELPTLNDLNKNKISANQSFLKKILNFIKGLLKSNTLEIFVDSLDFLGNDIVFIGQLKVSDEKYIIHLFLVDPTTGKISKDIDIKNLQYVDIENFNYIYDLHDQKEKLTINGLITDSNKKSLLIGFRGFSLQKEPLYLVAKDGKTENIIVDKEILDDLSIHEYRSIFPHELAISDNLIAISIDQFPLSSRQIMLWQRYPKLSLIDVIPKRGLINIKESFILISSFQYDRTFNNENSDHIFIQVNDDTTIRKSKIRWERSIEWEPYPNTPVTTGLIDSNSLLLSRYGTVVHLPIKNLPSSYEIKNSHCRSK